MPKLNPADHPNVTHDLIEPILERYGIRSFTYESSFSGIANTTLLISSQHQKAVLRIYRHGRTLEDIKLELDFIEMLERGGIPVATIKKDRIGRQIGQIKVDERKWFYILMNFVQGVHADEYTPAFMRDLAHIQGKMHLLGAAFSPATHLPKRGPKKLIENYNSRINRNKISSSATRAFLDRARDFSVTLPASLRSGYNHLDYDADNVLLNHDKIAAVLDFDDLEFTPIVMCLGYTLWDILDETDDIDQVRAYLAEYERVRPLDADEFDWIQPVILFRNYVIGAVDLLFYGNKSERINRGIALERVITKMNGKDLLRP